MDKQIRQIDQAIARDLLAIPQTVTSVSGMGPVYGAGIVAEIGPIARFPSDDALAKYAGLTGVIFGLLTRDQLYDGRRFGS